MPSVNTPDGRRLNYAIYGDVLGFPVIYCHGFPASRLEGKLFDGFAREARVRLIVPDRPGYGYSDYQRGRQISDWAEDVGHLADRLGLKRYSVVGLSGGAPYAVSCGVAEDPRLYRLGIVCGMGSMDKAVHVRSMGMPARVFIELAEHFPWLAIPFYSWIIGPIMHHFPGLVIAILSSGAPEVDKEIFKDETLRELHADALSEGFRQGGRGPAWDLFLYTHHWDIEIEDVNVPSFLWHGDDDRTVPVEMGHEYAERLVDCKAVFIPGEGHFSLPMHVMKGVLLTLKETA